MKAAVISLTVALSVVATISTGAVSYLVGSRADSVPASSTNVPAVAAPAAASAIPVQDSSPSQSPTVSPTPEVSTKTVYAAPKTRVAERVTLASLGSKPCATLLSRGVSYQRAWGYFREFGYPDSMDVDYDGYPCENAYGDMN